MNNFSEDDEQLQSLSLLDNLEKLIPLLPESPYAVIASLQVAVPWGWSLIETNAPEELANTLTLGALEKGFNDETPY